MRMPGGGLPIRGFTMIQVRRVTPSSSLLLSFFVALLFLQFVSCSSNRGGPPPTPTPTPLKGPTGAQATQPGEDGQWPMPAKNYASTRFSGLDEINASNVQNLKVAWTFSVGVNRGQEAAPIVVGDTMYVATPYPNILYALDLTKEKQGSVKWAFDPKTAAQGVACCDVVNRGAAYADGKVF